MHHVCAFPSPVRQLGLLAAAFAAGSLLGCSGSDTTNNDAAPFAAMGGNAGTHTTVASHAGSTPNGGASTSSGGAPAQGGETSTQSTSSRGSNGGAQPILSGVSGEHTSNAGTSSSSANAGLAGARNGGSNPSGGGSSSVDTGNTSAKGGTSNAGGTSAKGGTSNAGGTSAKGGYSNNGGSNARAGSESGGKSSCYTAPAEPIGTQARASTISGYGTVAVWAKTPHEIVRLQTRMVVPPKPPASGTLFLWPGLQPFGENFEPIDNGVLQPVLTWGPACAPVAQPRAYSTWWISGQYVNTNGSEPGYTDCLSGPAMSVNVCDTLDIDIELSGTVWTQTVVNERTNQQVAYSIDMRNQAQNLAYFVIEEYSSTPVTEVIFTDTTLTFASPDAADCKVYMRGQSDFVSNPEASSDGTQCSIAQIILRAQGLR